MAVTIDARQCMGCGACVMACPNDALSLQQDGYQVLVKVDAERCTDCGACIPQCPIQIIQLPGDAAQAETQPPQPAAAEPPPPQPVQAAPAHDEPATETEEWNILRWRPGRGQMRKRLKRRFGIS